MKKNILIYILYFIAGIIAADMIGIHKDINVMTDKIIELSDKIIEVEQRNQIDNNAVLYEENLVEHITTEDLPLCGSEHGSFKSYMDYRCVTDRTSAQYQLIYSDDIVVGEDGLLYCGEYVGVATASRFGNIGDKLIIKLDSGAEFKAIKLDEKADAHTINGCHHDIDGSMIEFVIDISKAKEYYPNAIIAGSFDVVDCYNGVVTQILKVIG